MAKGAIHTKPQKVAPLVSHQIKQVNVQLSAGDTQLTLDIGALRAAEADGRVILNLPLDQIETMTLMRDRTLIDESELHELQLSITKTGLRLPIEVTPTEAGYALISGYRRLLATQRLAEMMPNEERFKTIRAIVRPVTDAADALRVMVEENELRASVSPYERGRIAVISASEGCFENTEAAISALFSTASPSKRSKIKSFAEVFEWMGDVLIYPEDLTERRGLRLASAIRQGGARRLQEALAEAGGVADAEAEWAILAPVINHILDDTICAAKKSRPRMPPAAGWSGDTLHLASGISLRKENDGRSYILRIMGHGVTSDILAALMEEVLAKLSPPR